MSKTSFFHKPELGWERFIPYDLTNAFYSKPEPFLIVRFNGNQAYAIVESYDSSMF